MGLKITISEIVEESIVDDAIDDTSDDGYADRYNEEEDDETCVVLTSYTVKDCKRVTEDISGRNEFLSKYICGVELNGRFSIADPSKERLSVNELFEWYKKPAHEKEAYKKIDICYLDVNNQEYDRITFNKAFVVNYFEKGTLDTGTIEFKAFIRNFDKTEEAVKV